MEPRTQLPWWTVTSHLWRALSSRASGVRLQISTLSKWALKSSNDILRQRQGRVIGHHNSSCLHGQPPDSLPGEGDTPGVPPRRMETGKKTEGRGKGMRKEREKRGVVVGYMTPIKGRRYQNSPSSSAEWPRRFCSSRFTECHSRELKDQSHSSAWVQGHHPGVTPTLRA